MSFTFAQSTNIQSTTNSFIPVSSEDFKNILDSTSVVLIDVRTEAEFTEGYIAGAINIEFNHPDFEELVKKVSNGKPIALYCRSGRRSKTAANKLNNLKVEIYELNNGILDWQQKDLPLKK
jgi:rhodanese-related sulfurtransferase